MDDDLVSDADFAAFAAAVETSHAGPTPPPSKPPTATTAPPKIQQPTPQTLPSRHAPSSILVSPRQKGNPVLKNIAALPWEYADIPADFTLGATTCALFLSLKYHRLHPEYIYGRIRALQKQYNLRVLLTMVDIENHEASLRELSKTSLVNNLTLILCWSAREAARYLELYKSFENASSAAIRAVQGTGYAERMVEFCTTVRSVNRADAVGLVSAFGSVRAAVNAGAEEVAGISGWGEKKVGRWCGTVREGFRVRRAGRKEAEDGKGRGGLGRGDSLFEDEGEGTGDGGVEQVARLGAPIPVGRISSRETNALNPPRIAGTPDAERRPPKRLAEEVMVWEPGDDEEEALLLAAAEEEGNVLGHSRVVGANTNHTAGREPSKKARPDEPEMSEGIAAALAKLRQS